jgi:hypothetical protein
MRTVAAACLLMIHAAAWAQEARDLFDLAHKETGWVDQLSGGRLSGWEVPGVHRFDKDLLVIDSAGGGVIHSLAPLGDRFKVLIEYRFDSPAGPELLFEQRDFFGSTFGSRGLPGRPNEWVELLIEQQPQPGGSGYRLLWAARSLEPGGLVAGDVLAQGAPVGSLELVVHGGNDLKIRRLRVLASPTAATVAPVLMTPFIVLGALLAGVMGVGWWLQRRSRKTRPSP